MKREVIQNMQSFLLLEEVLISLKNCCSRLLAARVKNKKEKGNQGLKYYFLQMKEHSS